MMGLEGLSVGLFTRVLGWSRESVDVFLAEVRKDLSNTAIHAYWPVYVSDLHQSAREAILTSIIVMSFTDKNHHSEGVAFFDNDLRHLEVSRILSAGVVS